MCPKPVVGVVDYGLGNLYSLRLACERAGLSVSLVDTARAVAEADALLLPGVGAFGDAMAALEKFDLVHPVRDFVATGRPFLGICLGLQLLFDESDEFGSYGGLGLISGKVARLAPSQPGTKVPLVGWKSVQPAGQGWQNTLLAGVPAGAYFYFVHSFHVVPAIPAVELCQTTHGGQTFCAGIRRDNVTALQFHPERSGEHGLAVFRNFAQSLGAGVD